MFDFGVLGINARNLLFIKKFNKEKDINLADDKLKTKHYLHNRGIPVAKLFAVIHNRTELSEFDFLTLPENFVIKPNKGSKGRGILVVNFDKVKYTDMDPEEDVGTIYQDKEAKIFRVNGKEISESQLKNYMIDILDGKYSMGVGADKIIIEEKLIPSKGYSRYCEYGLADIRVISFNLIPVAAMIRVPTKISGGKANLAQGGIGFGIEVGTGKIKNMYFKGKLYKKEFPGEYADFYDKKISYWDDILSFSSQIQYFVNLGYLALDWVVAKDGPKILELNARAGLSIQNASNLHLWNRLRKLEDIKVHTPEKGVQIAKSLFCSEDKSLINPTKVLYLSQKGKLIDDANNEIVDLTVEVDIKNEKNFISKDLFPKIEGKKFTLDFYDNDVEIKNIILNKSDNIGNNKILLGTRNLEDFYIKPIHKKINLFGVINPTKLLENEIDKLKEIDERLFEIRNKAVIMDRIKPLNNLDELDMFISQKGDYNPIFEYRFDDEEDKNFLENIKTNLEVMKEDYFNKGFFKSKFALLFDDAISETLDKISLIKNYSECDFNGISQMNKKLFGDFTIEKLNQSKKMLFEIPNSGHSQLGDRISSIKLKKFVRDYLKERGFNNISITVHNSGLSRISILNGNTIRVRISNLAKFREKELYSTLAHEVDVHLTRAINGDNSGWKLLRLGTGYYTKTEEGLAAYKSFEKLPKGYIKKGIYKSYYYANEAMKYDFKDLAMIFRDVHGYSYLKSFYAALRLKRGIKDTNIIDKGAVFLKDKVYLDGYLEIEKYVQDGGDLSKLMIGKIKIEDLDYII